MTNYPAGVVDSGVRRVEDETRAYEHGHDQPIAGYATAVALFAGTGAALVAIAALQRRRLPDRFAVGDLVLGGLATHKFARLVAKDAVTSPIRMPFTRFDGAAGAGELNEEVRGCGTRQVTGEMLSCPFCLAP